MRLRLMCGLFLLSGMVAGPVAIGAEAPRILSLHMISRRSGWAISGTKTSYHILRTCDGGRRWNDVSPDDFSRIAPNDWDHDINQKSVGSDFRDARSAWLAVADEQWMYVYHTTNGGQSWTQAQFRTDVGDRTYIQFLDRQHGFILSVTGPAAGQMGKHVYRTTNGGQTWQPMSMVMGEKYGYWSFYPSGMTFRSPTEGWITGSYHGEPPVPFLHTQDGGRTWEVAELPIPELLADGYADTEPPIFFGKSRRRGVVTAMLANHRSTKGDLMENAAFFTRDGGLTWRVRRMPPAPFTPSSICFANAQDGWILDGNASLLYGTHDSGCTWHRLTAHLRRRQVPGIVDYDNSQIDFITAQIGWALIVGKRDVSLPPQVNRPAEIELRQTQDGGRHWRAINPTQE